MQINRTFLNDFCNYFTFLRTTLRYNAAFLRTTTSVIHYVKYLVENDNQRLSVKKR